MKIKNNHISSFTAPDMDENLKAKRKLSLLIFAILLASMGYFVDIYDLLLFSIVRVPSLKSLGFTGQF